MGYSFVWPCNPCTLVEGTRLFGERRAICAIVKTVIAALAPVAQSDCSLESLHGLHVPIMTAARRPTGTFDPSDAIAVITGYRKRRFPLEREFAFSAFVTWMLFPTRPEFIWTGQVVYAANYFLNSRPARRNSLFRDNPYLSKEILAKTLLSVPLADTYRMEFESASNEIDNIFEIVNFFMICPSDRKPSLLKAMYFIDAGGFIPKEVEKQDRKYHKRSATTLKNSWVNYAVTGAFVWAAISFDFDHLLQLSPEQVSTIGKIRKFLADEDAVLDFFGAAKFCQERLISRLDARSKSRFRFVNFPSNIVARDVEIPEFDAAEMAILEAYRAPQ